MFSALEPADLLPIQAGGACVAAVEFLKLLICCLCLRLRSGSAASVRSFLGSSRFFIRFF